MLGLFTVHMLNIAMLGSSVCANELLEVLCVAAQHTVLGRCGRAA